MKLSKFLYAIHFLIFTSLFSNDFASRMSLEKPLEAYTQKILISNKSSWIRDVDYEEDNIEENTERRGMAFLLYHEQFNLENGERYLREVKKIVSQTVPEEACFISFIYDFKMYDLIIHTINIIRNGEVIDRLQKSKRRFFYPNNVQNLQETVFYIDNLQTGDVIDTSVSFVNKKDFLQLDFPGMRYPLEGFFPYKKIVYECLTEINNPIYWETNLFEQDPVCSLRDNYKIYSWEINDYNNVKFLPVTIEQPTLYPSIDISKVKLWNDIAKFYATVLEEKTKFFPAPPEEITKLIDEWRDIYPTKEEQILAAIRFVSDDIYYMSFPDAENEHYQTPYSPNKTVEKGSGDCKDKSYLLIAILNLLDIEAYPTLVNTQYVDKNRLPMLFANHIIVNIQYDGKSYFIDTTTPLQGGTLNTYQISNFGYGLILKEDSQELVPITRNYLSKFQSITNISIQDSIVNWDHTIQYCHQQADMLRTELIPGYIAKDEKILLSEIESDFPLATNIVYISPAQIEDDRQANVITKKFSLVLENSGMKTLTGIIYDFSPLVTVIPLCDYYKKSSKPFSLEDHGLRIEKHRTITIHCDKPPTIEEKTVEYADDNLSYKLSIEKISDTDIQIILHQETLKDYIEADKLAECYEKFKELKEHLNLTIKIPD